MKERRVPIAGCIALILALSVPAGRAQQPTPQRAPGSLNEGVRAILVDVVVRDRRGQPVKDLSPADFELTEDGATQSIASFTPVFEATGAPASAPAPPSAPGSAPAVATSAPVDSGPAVTALVFHGLSPEGRRRAVQAAQSYLGAKEETANYIGIFNVDLAMTPIVPFTRNGFAVRQALTRMASGGAAAFNSPEQQQQRANAERQAAMAGQAAASATAAGGPGASSALGTAPGEAQLAAMQANMIKGFEFMESDQQGYAFTNGLLAIVNVLGRLPGRKSIVLFSEGVAIPPNVLRLFRGVIDAANRGNVSIYTMDAAGLRAESDQLKTAGLVNQAGNVGISSGYSADSGGGAFTKELEANEGSLRADPAMGLGQLAQETGGLFFNNTNNLRQGFERVDSDQRNYYLLGYTPTNTRYDGRFRTIAVKVKRSGLTIAARKGYFAVRDPGGVAVNPWEAPALGALEQKPVPNAFPVRALALLFPERGRPGLVPVVVSLGTSPLTFQPAPDGKNYTSDFTVLVRFLDNTNQVARKVSQHYEVTGVLSEIERAKQGEVIFYRESELPAGVYTMETVVHDALSGKSSVRFSTVEVPRYAEGSLRMSSLMLVKRGEKVADKGRPTGNPLLVNDLVLQPNLGDPVSKAAKEVGFYFAIYPAQQASATDSSIELLLNGKLVARVPMPVGTADAAGRVQQLGRLPLEQLAPGTYELRAVVKQGTEQTFRSTMLRIIE